MVDMDAADVWVCSACTFHNRECEESCSMCHTIRPGFLWFLAYYASSFSICRFLHNLLYCSLTAAFAIVGAFSGSIAGAFTGCAAHSGFFRGAGLGAVAGAALSVEILDASRNYWLSRRSSSGPRPTMIDFLEDLCSGRFVHDFVVPAISATQQWQLNFMDMSYEELYEVFVPEGRLKGASQDFLKRLPQHIVTQSNLTDTCGDVIGCAICLQELEQGDIVRALPICNHTFHLKCVDKWLVTHVICPICRHYVH